MSDTRQDRPGGTGDEVGTRATTLGNGPASSVRDDGRASAAESATGEPESP